MWVDSWWTSRQVSEEVTLQYLRLNYELAKVMTQPQYQSRSLADAPRSRAILRLHAGRTGSAGGRRQRCHTVYTPRKAYFQGCPQSQDIPGDIPRECNLIIILERV